MNAAIYYHSEAYSTQGPKLMGRNAAGESFLRGFIQHSASKEFWALVSSDSDAKDFTLRAREGGRSEPVKLIQTKDLGALSQAGVLYYPGPDINEQAFKRRAITGEDSDWSLCGITHTTSSAGVMDAITNWLSAPLKAWDAVICTSEAVKKNVECLLSHQAEYLKDRLGAAKFELPQLPVIPLGVDVGQFISSDDEKIKARQSLQIKASSIVVLYVGRLSFHAKANPLAMYQALARVSAGKSVVLVECGWFANQYIEDAFKDAAKIICPSVHRIVLDGRDAKMRQLAWASADIFCSLSDNIQETFGITPVEAMSAGLPCLVSDWDGYKDTIRHGVDGFRIPTTMPKAGLGIDLANRYALGIDNYDMYCGNTSSFIAVDVDELSEKLELLVTDPSLRSTMGQSAHQRARDNFDWKIIVPKYEALWDELSKIRLKHLSQNKTRLRNANQWPARMDPFLTFSAYPTATLALLDQVEITSSNVMAAREQFGLLSALSLVNYTKEVNQSLADISQLIEAVGENGNQVQAVIENYLGQEKALAYRSIVWLMKLGVLRVKNSG